MHLGKISGWGQGKNVPFDGYTLMEVGDERKVGSEKLELVWSHHYTQIDPGRSTGSMAADAFPRVVWV